MAKKPKTVVTGTYEQKPRRASFLFDPAAGFAAKIVPTKIKKYSRKNAKIVKNLLDLD